MRIRQIKWWLWSSAGLMGTGALGVVIAAFWLPYQRPDSSAVNTRTGSAQLQSNQPEMIVALPPARHAVWRTPLRQPLQDQPTPTPTAKPSKPPRSFTTRLAGTVIEQDHSVAMFITRNGKIELKAVGEDVDNARVLDITPDRVSLRHNGRTLDLTLKKKEGM